MINITSLSPTHFFKLFSNLVHCFVDKNISYFRVSAVVEFI